MHLTSEPLIQLNSSGCNNFPSEYGAMLKVIKEFKVPARIEAVPDACDQAMEFLKQNGCATSDDIEVSLALQEALANAILHGCEQHPDCEVTVQLDCDPAGLSITVSDPGTGFDAEALLDPCSPRGQCREHGRGLLLMKAYMDDVTFSRNGATVTMRKYRERR
jgi:serine/threonine-protein kinase RsbW